MGAVLIVSGAALAAYGASLRMAGTGRSLSAVWFILAAALAVPGALMLTGIWQAIPAPVRWAAAAVGAAALIGFISTSARIMAFARAEAPEGLDWLIVLGAQVKDGGVPSRALRFRLERARDCLQGNPGACCIVSGGRGPDEPCPEAEAMAAWLVRAGIEPSRVHLESRSADTVGNVRLSRDLLERLDPGASRAARVGIVTNDFHLFRAVALARRQGIEDAVGVAAPSTLHSLPHHLLRECLGVVKDVLAGNM